LFTLNNEKGDKMLEKLIAEGEQVRLTCTQPGMIGHFITGKDYTKWIYKCTLFLEKTYPNQTVTTRFIEASVNALGNDEVHLDTMMGILKAIKEFESE